MILSLLAGLDSVEQCGEVGDDVRPTDRVVGTMGQRMRAFVTIIDRQAELVGAKYTETLSIIAAIRKSPNMSDEARVQGVKSLAEATRSRERFELLVQIFDMEIREEFSDLKPEEKFTIRTGWVVVAVNGNEGSKSKDPQPAEQPPDPLPPTNPRKAHPHDSRAVGMHRRGLA